MTSSIYYFTFYSTIVISLTVIVLYIVWIDRRGSLNWGLAVALILSKAFVDYSTSGLENPLVHLMLVSGLLLGFRFVSSKDEKFAVASLTILLSLYLCRPDLVLLMLPFCAYLFFSFPKTSPRFRYLLVALSPCILWTTFSFVYYGFLFPNTAYAKLGTDVSTFELIWQGLIYIRESFVRDPLTLLVILSGIVMSFITSQWPIKALGIGVNAYLVYLIWIGGDFMSGRFLTAPFLVSMMILGCFRFSNKTKFIQISAIVLCGLFCIRSTVMSGREYDSDHVIPKSGIVDERAYWFQKNGLFSEGKFRFSQPPWETTERSVWRTCGELGENGLGLTPSVHLIDLCGLSDPLLARMPSYNFGGNWRVGHYYRQVPTNYELAILHDNPDILTDRSVAEYWKELRIITNGKLFTVERIKNILAFNFGWARKPDFTAYKTERIPSREMKISELATMRNGQETSVTGFYNSIQIDLEKPVSIRSLDVSLIDSRERCVFKYEENGIYYPFAEILLQPSVLNQLQFKLKSKTPKTSRIRIEPDPDLEKPVSRTGIGHLYINTF